MKHTSSLVLFLSSSISSLFLKDTLFKVRISGVIGRDQLSFQVLIMQTPVFDANNDGEIPSTPH